MSQRVLAQVVAQLKRLRNHLQAQAKLLRRIRNQLNHQLQQFQMKKNDNQASAVAPKASSQKQAQAGTTDGGQVVESTTPASQARGVEGGRGSWTATSGTLTLDEKTPVYAAPDKDSGAVSTLPAGDVDWDKYEILPDGNWYSFVKNGQRYYISYSDVGH